MYCAVDVNYMQAEMTMSQRCARAISDMIRAT